MSYGPLHNYRNYYDSNQSQRNLDDSYNTPRQPTSTHQYTKQQASYPGDVGQSRYNSLGYDGSNQSQRQDYSSGSRQQSTYGNGGSKDVTTRSTSSDKWTQARHYAAQAAAGSSAHNYYNTSTSTSESTQGLNSLAYASGLDDAELQRYGQHVPRSNALSGCGYSMSSASHMPDGAQWPAVTESTFRHSTTPSYDPYSNGTSSSQHQGNSLSTAAAALAGAVSAGFAQATHTMGGHSSTSPVVESSTSAQQSVTARSASPYYPPQPVPSRSQRRQSPSPPQSTQSAQSTEAYQHRARPATSGQHGEASTRNPSSRTSPNNAQPVNAISSLITPSMEEPIRKEYPIADEQQAMPNYIDPTQVFNPYAKEHERRRREAAAQAETEAIKKKTEEEAAAKRSAQKAAMVGVEKKANQEKATTAKRAPKSHQKRSKPVGSVHPPASESAGIICPQPVDAATDGTASETTMALELKAMMEKMKEFRSKDPGLFQKLWDDMRKSVSGPASAVPLQSPSPQMNQQQTVPPASMTAPVQSGPQHQPTVEPMTAMPSGVKTSHDSDVTPNVPRPFKMNGYRVAVLDNPENLPDLGRFPAERRIRTKVPKPPAPSPAQFVLAQSTPAQLAPAQPVAVQPAVANQSPTASNQGTPAPPLQPQVEAAGLAAEAMRPLTQGLPPKGPAVGTIWPEDKRKALADAAIKALKEVPENALVTITPPDIDGMLEQNPSYIDLCELLEKKGLKFHRGQFARQLLSNVPYLNGPSGKPDPTPSSPALKRDATPSIPLQDLTVPSTAATVSTRAQGNAGNTRSQAINRGVDEAVFKSEKPLFGPPQSNTVALQLPRPRLSKPHPLARPEPPPGSKEANARKRDFSEVVDLTALSDNEDYVMSKKQARVASPSPDPTIHPLFRYENFPIITDPQRRKALGQLPVEDLLPAQSGVLEQPFRHNSNQSPHPRSYTPLPHFPAHQPGRALRIPPPIPLQQGPFKCLAKPVNKAEALRKTCYDAKTVARDLLIAIGRHPTERPLNAHLAGLLGKYIEIDSDLSTFEWDAIDPGGPPVPQVPYADVPTGPPRFGWGHRGIQPPKLEQQAAAAAGAPGAEARPASLPDSDKRKVPAPSTNRVSAPAHRPEEKPESDKARSPTSPLQVKTDLGPSHIVRRACGRPPREPERPRSSTPNSVLPQKRKTNGVVPFDETPASGRKRFTRSASTQLTPTIVPSTSSAKKMEAAGLYTSGKRRGRPPGSKIIHPASEAGQRAVAQISQMGISVPPKPMSPINPVFRCRWKGCQAHLHNLETIRNHVSKVHHPTSELLKEQNGYICWWKKCKLLVEDEDGKLGPSQIFHTRGDWLGHIEEAHLREVAQKLGYGPSLKHIGKQTQKRASFPFDVSKFSFNPASLAPSTPPCSSPVPVARTFSHTDPQTVLQDRTRFLTDPEGRVTTPDVTNPSTQEDLPADTMRLLKADRQNNEEQAQKAFIKTHRQEKSNPRAVAEETLKAMSARKAKIGPGIDRGGCILVTEERRATLIQNPGIQRVVEGDY
ncbi:hypothetical protein G647_07277 [Cladophialophora carrionii CBS 160.54]|uniref:Uncharacterized protein n=1 Tax=Cladophialophora carrionii CBS 160.54 TaxID=1279043 RepID=V9D1Z4_9EURO|nr:uncharacterized protein G647_07277 [Cladophialophora carrionii CBS 160.54]ETI20934.1 hypothetical protein G647_07277 [Cladophialophora carrionii CBS 160.54]